MAVGYEIVGTVVTAGPTARYKISDKLLLVLNVIVVTLVTDVPWDFITPVRKGFQLIEVIIQMVNKLKVVVLLILELTHNLLLRFQAT